MGEILEENMRKMVGDEKSNHCSLRFNAPFPV